MMVNFITDQCGLLSCPFVWLMVIHIVSFLSISYACKHIEFLAIDDVRL